MVYALFIAIVGFFISFLLISIPSERHAGATAPPGKRIWHAGAIISGGKGTADEKFSAFEKAGIHIARDPSKIGEVLVSVLIEAGLRDP